MENMSRLEELATLFEGAADTPTNILDEPFDCVSINLKPSTCAEIAKLFRSWQVLLRQAAQPRALSGEIATMALDEEIDIELAKRKS